MSSVTAQVSFAAELITMLVAASGLVLAARGSEVAERSRPSRWLLGVGFATLGVGAFLHGSLILASNPGTGLAASRLVAVVLLLAGSHRWQVGGRPRVLLLGGLGLVCAAAIIEMVGGPVVTGDILLAVGGVAVGFPLVVAGRQSIATRVAVATAGTLLLVLVVVSIAMSEVISSSVTTADLNRLAQRGRSEGLAASATANDALKDARFGGVYLQDSNPNPLAELASAGGSRDATDQALVVARLDKLSQIYPGGGFLYVLPHDQLALSSDGLTTSVQAVATSPTLQGTSCAPAGASRILLGTDAAWAVGTFPECGSTGTATGSGEQLLGTVVSVTPLNASYLGQRQRVDPTVSLALVAEGRVLAATGDQPPTEVLTRVTTDVARSGVSSTSTIGNRFVSAQPISGGGGTKIGLSMIVSSSTSTLVSTREKLFRTLFLIALGSTLAALALAVLVGERITAGVRRLTEVAGRIQAGQGSERAGALGGDEVGVLGAAFDSMIDSVEDHAAALQAAADDETRLRNRLEAVVAGIGDSLVAIDVEGRIIEINAAAEDLFGVHAPTVRGARIQTVIVGHGEDGAPLDELLGRPRATGWGALATVVAVGGVDVPVAISAGAVRGPAGELIGSVVVLRDLRSEQELERMKTEFLSRVGHELRTPLTGIMGYADILLRREVEPERARGWHAEILNGAKRLLRIVEMLEFFASAGAGRVRLRPEPLDVRSLVSGLATRWNARLEGEHAVVRRVEAETPQVLADRRWLVLAIDELVDNAAKFSPAGGKISIVAGVVTPDELPAGAAPGVAPSSVSSSVSSSPRRGGRVGRDPMVEISVIDRGEGMTTEEQAVAFGEFVQVDTSDTRRFGGLGLGLALVKRVVEGHGGTVSCQSVLGRGSTFVIRLPVGSAEDPVDQRSSDGGPAAGVLSDVDRDDGGTSAIGSSSSARPVA